MPLDGQINTRVRAASRLSAIKVAKLNRAIALGASGRVLA
jgi:hypothetical protein